MKEALKIHVGDKILIDNDIYKVLSTSFSGSARAEKQVKVSMKSIPEGKFKEIVYHPDDKVEDISPDIKKAQYTYRDNENLYFMDEKTFEQFPIPKSSFGKKIVFLREGQTFNIH